MPHKLKEAESVPLTLLRGVDCEQAQSFGAEERENDVV